MIFEHSVDLLYLAWNRLEFSRRTFTTLLANTDWPLVHTLFVCDDGSTDGTRQWLASQLQRCPAPVRWLPTHFGSPVTAMSHFIASATAPMLAKTDNDAMLPPGWLRQSLAVFERHPELHLLGIEAMYPHNAEPDCIRSYRPAEFISGLGLYRRSVFAHSRPHMIQKWFGLEEWQVAQGPALIRGWIEPALPVFLLDRLPLEPWRNWSQGYVARGWQRPWPSYDPACTLWCWAKDDLQEMVGKTCRVIGASAPRFIAAMRIRNEAAWIREVLTSALRLCEHAVVFDDHSTDETPEICRTFGDAVTIINSPFEGLDESRDKNFVLQQVIASRPDWVLWIDGDEVLERTGPEQLRTAADLGEGVAAYSLRVAYLWDHPGQVRVDGIYGRFRRESFFQLRRQDPSRLHFPASGRGGNFHCGNIPQGLRGTIKELDVRLKHYGYMRPERRTAKYESYTKSDPGNGAEDGYRHLIGLPGARFARVRRFLLTGKNRTCVECVNSPVIALSLIHMCTPGLKRLSDMVNV